MQLLSKIGTKPIKTRVQYKTMKSNIKLVKRREHETGN